MSDQDLPNENDIKFVLPTESAHRIKIKVVPPEKRITRNILTRTEMAAAIGYRATQISNEGSKIFVPYDDLESPINIAIRELQMSKFPLKLWRCVGREKEIEYWEEFDINNMVKIEGNILLEPNI